MTPHRACSIALASLLVLAACGKKGGGDAAPESASAAPPATQAATTKPAAPASFDVPFKGTYKKTAKVAFKNGQRFRTSTNQGTATMTIEAGKVTYHLEYQDGSKTAHVTETYSFTQADVRTIPEGFDVNITFVNMDADTKSYNPDSKNTKIEARKQGANAWEIGFLYQDTGGVQAGMEFR